MNGCSMSDNENDNHCLPYTIIFTKCNLCSHYTLQLYSCKGRIAEVQYRMPHTAKKGTHLREMVCLDGIIFLSVSMGMPVVMSHHNDAVSWSNLRKYIRLTDEAVSFTERHVLKIALYGTRLLSLGRRPYLNMRLDTAQCISQSRPLSR